MKFILTIFTLIFCHGLTAQISFNDNANLFSSQSIEHLKAPEFQSFTEVAAWSDLVAIAQVDEIEYEQVRNLNAKGYAFLNILIPYKGATKDQTIAVVATGFEDSVCYYPDRVNEGERFLLFLKKAPGEKNNVYYGFKPYCQMQILLSETGHYILRTPIDAKQIKIPNELTQSYTFNDPHALLDATLWTNISRQEYAEKYHCKIIQSEDSFNKIFHLRYTQGVPIQDIRPLLKLEYTARIHSKQI